MSSVPGFISIVAVSMLLGCSITKQNPDVCCETPEECSRVGLDDQVFCKTGACVRNLCVEASCDGPEDCSSAAPYCVASACVGCSGNETCSDVTPICDVGAHSCRRCTVDSECPSGVCDLATGSCAGETSILFVSPGGTTLDACTRDAPCSIAQAFTKVGAQYPYVEMTPGSYGAGGTLHGKTATIVADRATLRVTDASGQIGVDNQGSLTIRHLKLLTTTEGLTCTGTSSLEVVALETMGPGILGSECQALKVSASKFVDGRVALNAGTLIDAGLIIDRSRFLGRGPSVVGGSFFAVITNNLIVADEFALGLSTLFSGASSVPTRVEHNTIVGGQVECTATTPGGRERHFRSNILVDPTVPLPKANSCFYDFNLTMPPDFALGGDGNVTGDPKFVDRAGGDYHLQLGSPAIDKADPTSPDDHDLDDAPRPQGGRSDIGAFERAP
jgi:hypothetical protein